MQVACGIEFLPYIEVQPPIETSFFPGEFVPVAKSSAWSWRFGAKLGSVIVETDEPPPILYASAQASTDCTFRVTFQGNLWVAHRLRIHAIEISPVLLINCYYGSERLAGAPRRSSATAGGTLRLHIDSINLDKHVVSDLRWTYGLTRFDAYDPPGYEETSSAQSERRAASDDVGQAPGGFDPLRMFRTNSMAKKDPPEVWHTVFKVPVSPPLRLPPSFCADFVAVSYSLLYKISIVGVYTKSLYLTAPLQVACPRRKDLPGSSGLDAQSSDPGLDNEIAEVACCVSVIPDLEIDHVCTPSQG